MNWKPRLITADELDATADVTAVAFGAGPVAPPDHRGPATLAAEVDRTFVVEDGPAIVGTGGNYSFEVALPGGTVPMAAVTYIGVLPTHRRRGILRALLDALLDQAVERGEPVAGLTASEGGIYGRFGFGVAARFQTLRVERARAAEVGSLPPPAGRVRLAGEDEAATLLPAVWDRHWRRVPGETGRTPGWWASERLDPESRRGGASARFVAVHEDGDGSPDGYAVYRIRQDWRAARHELQVEAVAAADDAAEAALVRFLLDVDLVGTVVWWAAPIDHPLRWRLVDPRAVEVTAERDHLWLRPLDVARCLAARRYAVEGGLVVEVFDPARPEVGGRFRLDGGPDGADCARTNASPEIVVATPQLGSLLLGGVSWATLRRAGLADERTPGAVDRADALFRPERAPFCATDF